MADDRRPEVAELVEELAHGGHVIEFGCGEGHLAAQVDPSCYSSYVGYDVAQLAVDAANRNRPSDKCRFEVLDIAAWPGHHDVDLVIAEECLYYLRPAELHRVLDRTVASLGPDGAMLATFHDPTRYPDVIGACRVVFSRREESRDGDGSLFMVLRP